MVRNAEAKGGGACDDGGGSSDATIELPGTYSEKLHWLIINAIR